MDSRNRVVGGDGLTCLSEWRISRVVSVAGALDGFVVDADSAQEDVCGVTLGSKFNWGIPWWRSSYAERPFPPRPLPSLPNSVLGHASLFVLA